MAKTNSKNSVNNSVNPDASNVKKPLLKGITVVFDTWKSIIEHFESDLTLDYCVITDNQTRTIDIRKIESQLTEQPTYIIGKQKGTGQILQEIITGYKSEDLEPLFVAVNRDCIKSMIQQSFSPMSLFEIHYLAEKSGGKEIIFELGDSKSNNQSFTQHYFRKIRTSVNYYKGNLSKYPNRLIFLLSCILGLVGMTYMSRSAAISGDEFTQYEYSKLIANYYLEPVGLGIPIDTNDLKFQRMPTLTKNYTTYGSKLATIEDPDRLMHVYGSSFDTFTTILGHWFGVKDIMSFRHFWNAIFGFLVAFYAGLIARRLTKGNWGWATLAMISVILMPRFFGEAMNNPKDIPFALGYVMSLYYAIKTFQSWPNFRWNSALGLVLSTALGISIRIGGLLSVGIFILYGGLKFLENLGWKNAFQFRWKGFGKFLFGILVLGVASYVFGILPWPYGWDNPIDNPLKALKEFTNYSVSLRQLYDGKLYDSDMLPLSYLTNYLFISTPVILLFGFFCSLLISIVKARRYLSLELFLILFATIFPIFYIYLQKSQVYGGIRQIMFTLPCLVIVSIYGYYAIGEILSKKMKLGGAISMLLLLVGLLTPATHIAKNHPISYIYFNEIYGGTEKAYGEYEMDYYLASLKPSTDWFLENVARKNPNKKFEVLSYGMEHVRYYCRNDKNVHVGYTRFDDRSSKQWDYCIFYNAYFDKTRLNSGEFSPTGTVFQPKVDGKPVGIVIQRPSTDDYLGIKAVENSNFQEGIALLTKYLAMDPARSEIYFYLSAAYASTNQLDSAVKVCDIGYKYFPENSKILYAKYDYLLKLNRFAEAAKVMDEYIGYRPKDSDGFINKAQAELMLGKPMDALATLQQIIPKNPLDVRLYQLGSEAYRLQKDLNNMNLYGQASNLNNTNPQTQQLAVEAIAAIYFEITGEEFDLNQYLK
jgi:tetratricopeptide (TPR) repeat protein